MARGTSQLERRPRDLQLDGVIMLVQMWLDDPRVAARHNPGVNGVFSLALGFTGRPYVKGVALQLQLEPALATTVCRLAKAAGYSAWAESRDLTIQLYN